MDEDLLAEAAAKYPVRRQLLTANNSDIILCDERVPILEVLRQYTQVNVPGYRYKAHCPFAAEHPEESQTERCFQVYESNTAWCFVHNQRYTSSQLLGLVRGWGRMRAARYLLDKYRVAPRLSYLERNAELLGWMERRQQSAGDVQELAMTLASELAEDPQYSEHEFDPPVRQGWVDVLEALRQLVAGGADADVLRSWYATSKAYLKRVVLTTVQPSA